MDGTAPSTRLLPGDGWMVSWYDDEGAYMTLPVVAWRHDQALTATVEGFLQPVEELARDARGSLSVWHPSMTIKLPDGSVREGSRFYDEPNH